MQATVPSALQPIPLGSKDHLHHPHPTDVKTEVQRC